MTDHLDNARTNIADVYMELVALKAQMPHVPEHSAYRLARLLDDAIRAARTCSHSLAAMDETMLREAK